MTAVARCATLIALLAGALACGGEPDSPSTGHAEIASRSTTLSVGDTMTLMPGILYNDGRWLPLDNRARLSVEDTVYANIDTVTRILRGKKPGLAVVVLDISQVGSVKKNYNIIP